jgi:predicted nucleotidyltransferase
MRLFGSSVEAEVLEVLARGESRMTGRQVSRMIEHRAYESVRRALDRLVEHGIVLRESAGRSHIHQLAREHIAAPSIIALANLRLALFARMRDAIAAWAHAPIAVVLFGSAARGDGVASSDIDLLVIRPSQVDIDDEAWRATIARFECDVHAWTGNSVEVIEYAEGDLAAPGRRALLEDVVRDGIELGGSLAVVRRALRGVA